MGFKYDFVNNKDEVSYTYFFDDPSIISRVVVDNSGLYQILNDGDLQWKEFYSAPKYWCDNYRHCGAYGKCGLQSSDNVDNFECTCLPGYEPKSPKDWYHRDGSEGCVRKKSGLSMCGSGDGFVKVIRLKGPDSFNAAWLDMNMSSSECEQACLNNCSCTAFISMNIDGMGTHCLAWYGELMDIVEYSYEVWDLNVRVDAKELGSLLWLLAFFFFFGSATYAKMSKGFLGNKRKLVITILSVAVPLFLASLVAFTWLMKKRKRKGYKIASIDFSLESNELKDSSRHPDLLIFDLSCIVAATDNFSLANKLGQGGFGSVFKDEENMLIYEYMPNKSLDSFIFDQTRSSLLNWRKRFEIIIEIAHGILYLHQDSRLRIIHRDLKTRNVLLDIELNPKISDFGIAHIFKGDQIQDETTRIVGTYGYMSSKYVIFGKFSTKSDVFSLGVILLEIISGKSNNNSYQNHPSQTLIGHVWELWREDKAFDIVDSSINETFVSHEVLRCIQIGLLCVQENVSNSSNAE